MTSRHDYSQCVQCRQTSQSSAALPRHMRGEHRAAGRFLVRCFVPGAFLVASSCNHQSRWDNPHYIITAWTLHSCSLLHKLSPAHGNMLSVFLLLYVLLIPVVFLLAGASALCFFPVLCSSEPRFSPALFSADS